MPIGMSQTKIRFSMQCLIVRHDVSYRQFMDFQKVGLCMLTDIVSGSEAQHIEKKPH